MPYLRSQTLLCPGGNSNFQGLPGFFGLEDIGFVGFVGFSGVIGTRRNLQMCRR